MALTLHRSLSLALSNKKLSILLIGILIILFHFRLLKKKKAGWWHFPQWVMFEITSLPPVPFLALQDGKGHLCCVHVLLNNDLGLCLLLPTPQHTYVHHPCKGSPCPPTRIYAGLVSVQEGVSLSSCLGSGLRIQLCCLPSQGHPWLLLGTLPMPCASELQEGSPESSSA